LAIEKLFIGTLSWRDRRKRRKNRIDPNWWWTN